MKSENKSFIFAIICLFYIPNFRWTRKKESINKPLPDVVSRNSFRVGVALQKSLSAEIGFARHKMPNPHKPHCAYRFSPQGFYSSVEWIAKTENYKSVLV